MPHVTRKVPRSVDRLCTADSTKCGLQLTFKRGEAVVQTGLVSRMNWRSCNVETSIRAPRVLLAARGFTAGRRITTTHHHRKRRTAANCSAVEVHCAAARSRVCSHRVVSLREVSLPEALSHACGACMHAFNAVLRLGHRAATSRRTLVTVATLARSNAQSAAAPSAARRPLFLSHPLTAQASTCTDRRLRQHHAVAARTGPPCPNQSSSYPNSQSRF
mgnify:CR=1 FL=1